MKLIMTYEVEVFMTSFYVNTVNLLRDILCYGSVVKYFILILCKYFVI